MNVLVGICTLALAALVVYFVSLPLRRITPPGQEGAAAGSGQVELSAEHAGGLSVRERELRRDELETAREAKYREIRDAELDFRTGKLSGEDYEAIDADLRAEALQILNGLRTLGVDDSSPVPPRAHDDDDAGDTSEEREQPASRGVDPSSRT
jgi:hypothetical protein